MPRTGRPPHQRNLTGAVTDAAASAGLEHTTAQDLRRSFASIAARRIPDPAEAAHMTGHSLDVSVRHYVGRFGPAQRAEARARLLAGGLGAVTDDDADIPEDELADRSRAFDLVATLPPAPTVGQRCPRVRCHSAAIFGRLSPRPLTLERESPANAGLSSIGAPRFELGTSSPPD